MRVSTLPLRVFISLIFSSFRTCLFITWLADTNVCVESFTVSSAHWERATQSILDLTNCHFVIFIKYNTELNFRMQDKGPCKLIFIFIYADRWPRNLAI